MTDDRRHTIQITQRQATLLSSMCRIKRRQTEKALAKSTFIPAPGKRDANAVLMELLDALIPLLKDAARGRVPQSETTNGNRK